MWKGKIFKIQKNSNIWLQKEQMKESPTIFREWIKVLKVIRRPLEKYSNSLGYILLKYQNIFWVHNVLLKQFHLFSFLLQWELFIQTMRIWCHLFWAQDFENSKKIVLKLSKFLPSNLSNLSNQWPYFSVHPYW